MKMTKRLRLLTAIVVVLGIFAFGYEPASAQQHRKILVAYVAPGLTQAIPWITKEAALFAKHGIEAQVILLTGSPRIIQTLIAGDIDYAIGGTSSVLRARMRGADPIILATTTNFSGQQVLLRTDSTLQRLQALKGKTVGVTKYGSEEDSLLS